MFYMTVSVRMRSIIDSSVVFYGENQLKLIILIWYALCKASSVPLPAKYERSAVRMKKARREMATLVHDVRFLDSLFHRDDDIAGNQLQQVLASLPLPAVVGRQIPCRALARCFGIVNMAAKPSFPGRRICRTERYYVQHVGYKKGSEFMEFDCLEDVVHRLTEFHNLMEDSDEV